MVALAGGLLAAFALGLLAHFLKVPGGAVVGAMLGAALYNFSGAPRAVLPTWGGLGV